MGTIASQITSLTNVNSTVYSGADQSKHQSSMSAFDDVIMKCNHSKTKLCVWDKLHIEAETKWPRFADNILK